MLTWLINVRSPGGFNVLNEAQGNAVVGTASPNVTYQIAASGAGATDIIMRTGSYPYAPPFPSSTRRGPRPRH